MAENDKPDAGIEPAPEHAGLGPSRPLGFGRRSKQSHKNQHRRQHKLSQMKRSHSTSLRHEPVTLVRSQSIGPRFITSPGESKAVRLAGFPCKSWLRNGGSHGWGGGSHYGGAGLR